MKKNYTDWAKLKKIAEISPKEYGQQIVERNQKALEYLEKMWDNGLGGPEAKTLELGCPHCSYKQDRFDCKNCLYSKVIIKTGGYFPCTTLYFGGYCYHERIVQNTVELSDKFITIYMPDSEGQYKAAKIFLKKHIEWGKKDYWGKKYKS